MTKKAPIKCPECGSEFHMGKPMQHHLKDAHGIVGMKNHMIANPNDTQAKRSATGRRAASKPKRIIGVKRDDFDLIDDGDVWA